MQEGSLGGQPPSSSSREVWESALRLCPLSPGQPFLSAMLTHQWDRRETWGRPKKHWSWTGQAQLTQGLLLSPEEAAGVG